MNGQSQGMKCMENVNCFVFEWIRSALAFQEQLQQLESKHKQEMETIKIRRKKSDTLCHHIGQSLFNSFQSLESVRKRAF